jgi:uncharacterized protein YgiM (DUF1202 family)
VFYDKIIKVFGLFLRSPIIFYMAKQVLRGAGVATLLLISLLNENVTLAQSVGPNLLTNPDFSWPEQKNPDVCAGGWMKDNAVTPRGWTAYWTCKNAEESNQDQINRPPEFRLMNADITEQIPRVRSYPTSASYFNFFSLQRSAGVLQVVPNITPGSRLRFSIWVNMWSTNTDDVNSNQQNGGLQARACIDTRGTTVSTPNLNDPAIVCGGFVREYDKFVQVSVEATAAANQVTVFLNTSSDYPVKHNDVHADDAELVAIGGPAIAAQAQTQTTVAAAPTSAQVPTAPTTNDAKPKVTANQPSVNLRAAPSLSAFVVGRVPQGTELEATAFTADKQWWQIKYQGGSGGLAYVNVSVVTPNGAAQAGMSGGVVAQLNPPSQTRPQTQSAPPPAAPSVNSLPTLPSTTTTSEAVVTANVGTSRLLVRAAPSTSGRVLSRVVTGTTFIVTGISPDKKFWKVSFPSAPGGEAWVMISWTTPNASAKQLLGV